jgi:hypothetical protein
MTLFEQGVVILYDGHGHQNVTVGTSPASLPTPSVGWGRVRRVVVRNLGQPIDWTNDGTTPDGETSMKSLSDDVVVLDTDFLNFRMVRSPDATADADVRVAYFGV